MRIGAESTWIPHEIRISIQSENITFMIRITQREFENCCRCENLTTEDTESTEEDTESPLELFFT